MREVRLKIDKVVDVAEIIKRVVKNKLRIDVNSYYKKRIETTEKDLYIYVFEYGDTKWRPETGFDYFRYAYITTIITITVIASIKDDSTVIVVILPADDENNPNNSIVFGLREEGFRIVKVNGNGHMSD